MAARMPMIATTIISSMSVKPRWLPTVQRFLFQNLVIAAPFAIYENGFSVKAHLLIPAPPVDGAAGPVSPSLLAMVAGVARAARGGRRKIPLSIYPRM